MRNRNLTGLQRICKMFGSMKVNDTLMVWDYAKDVAVPESEMPLGSKRWRKSERTKYEQREKN